MFDAETHYAYFDVVWKKGFVSRFTFTTVTTNIRKSTTKHNASVPRCSRPSMSSCNVLQQMLVAAPVAMETAHRQNLRWNKFFWIRKNKCSVVLPTIRGASISFGESHKADAISSSPMYGCWAGRPTRKTEPQYPIYSQYNRLTGTVGWERTTKAVRLGSIPGRVIPKTWKMVLAACPASCSALMDGCKETVDCWHRLAASAVFIAKVAAWPTAQEMGPAGQSWPSEGSTKSESKWN